MSHAAAPPVTSDRLFGARSGFADVQAESISGGLAFVAASAAIHAIRFAAMLVVTRLLTPADFGVFAVVMAFAGAAGLFWEMGFAAATVQRKVITPQQVSTLFWINVSCAACVTMAGLAGAPWMGRVYGDERITAMCTWVAFSPPLAALGMQHLALLQRALQFRRAAAIGLVAAAAGSAVTVLLALRGVGFAALAAGLLTTNAVTTALAWRACRWRPGPFRIDPATREMLAFAGQLLGFGVLAVVANGLHSALLGLVSGTENAGLYHRAHSLLQLAQGLTFGAIGTVATAALSHLQDRPGELRDYYLRCARLLCTIAAPAAALGALFPRELIVVIYGEQWVASAPLFGVLSLGFVCSALMYSTGWLYIATGNARGMTRWGVIGWPLIILGTLIGLPLGLQGLAVAQTLAVVVAFVPCMTLAFRGTPITWRALAASAWRTLAAALATAAPLLALMPQLPGTPWLRLVAGVGLYASAYLFLLSEPLGQRADLVQLARLVLGRTSRTTP